VRLDRLTANVAADARLWSAVREQLRAGTMLPEDEKQPPSVAAKSLLDWSDPALQRTVARLPNDGNLVPPELLFGKLPRDGAAAPPRDWRLSPDGYLGCTTNVRPRAVRRRR